MSETALGENSQNMSNFQSISDSPVTDPGSGNKVSISYPFFINQQHKNKLINPIKFYLPYYYRSNRFINVLFKPICW